MDIRINNRQSGLTLLEVMLAITLIAVGVIPLLVTHSSSLQNFVRSRETTLSGFLAQEKIAALEAEGFQEDFSGDGIREEPPRLSWEERIATVREDLMASAEVRVRPGSEESRGRARELQLVTYLVNPRYAEATLGEEPAEVEPAEAVREERRPPATEDTDSRRRRSPVADDRRPVPIPRATPFTPPSVHPPVPVFSPVPPGRRDDGFVPGPPSVPTPFRR